MIKEVVGSKNYSVWLGMLKRLVPHGRTHRLSVVVASMLQVAYEIAQEREESNAKARQLSSIFESASEHDEENGIEPLLKITEQVFKDAGVGVKLLAHRAGLPGKEISFILCPLTPQGLRGTCRSNGLIERDRVIV